jgi:hypothetical protein
MLFREQDPLLAHPDSDAVELHDAHRASSLLQASNLRLNFEGNLRNKYVGQIGITRVHLLGKQHDYGLLCMSSYGSLVA